MRGRKRRPRQRSSTRRCSGNAMICRWSCRRPRRTTNARRHSSHAIWQHFRVRLFGWATRSQRREHRARRSRMSAAFRAHVATCSGAREHSTSTRCEPFWARTRVQRASWLPEFIAVANSWPSTNSIGSSSRSDRGRTRDRTRAVSGAREIARHVSPRFVKTRNRPGAAARVRGDSDLRPRSRGPSRAGPRFA
jgi:hypothetical protein